MRKSILLFLLFICSSLCFAQFSKEPTWKDEFSGKGPLNKEMWKLRVSKESSQLTTYTDNEQNVYLKGGKLHIKLFKSNDKEALYPSGEVQASKKYWFKKGKIEIRAKAPKSPGVWPAIWFNGPKTKDGYFAELDLMEYIYAMGDSSYEAVYHLWGDFDGNKHNHVSYGEKVLIDVGKWHIYTLEVTDDKLLMKVDGKNVYEIVRGQYGDEWPQDQEYMLRMDVAYGGWGASKTGTDDSALPAEMLVDYVRYYEWIEYK